MTGGAKSRHKVSRSQPLERLDGCLCKRTQGTHMSGSCTQGSVDTDHCYFGDKMVLILRIQPVVLC